MICVAKHLGRCSPSCQEALAHAIVLFPFLLHYDCLIRWRIAPPCVTCTHDCSSSCGPQ